MEKTIFTSFPAGGNLLRLGRAVFLLLAVCCTAGLQQSLAQCPGTPISITSTYTSVMAGPVDGRTINGVEYSGVASVTPAPATFQGLSGNVVEGSVDEELTLDFPVAANRIEFNFAVSRQRSVSPAARITLFDEAGALINEFNFDAAVPTGFSFAEGKVSVAASNIRRAVLRFRTGEREGRFAMDNLVVEYGSPAIIAADETLTVPFCSATASVIYSFQVLGCSGFNPNSIVAFINGPSVTNLQPNLRFASEEGGTYVYEFAADLSAGDFTLTIDDGAGGVDPLTVTIRVNAANNPNPILSFSPTTITLPSCSPSATVTGALTIVSCDDNINAGSLTVPAGLTLTSTNAAGNYREYSFTVTSAHVATGRSFTFSYTDQFGNPGSITANVKVLQTNAFDAPPTIVYPSNEVILTLDPCETLTPPYTFSVTAVDECDGNVTPVVRLVPDPATGLAPFNLTRSGNSYTFSYPKGNHRVDITATDSRSNSRTESFKITVLQDDTRLPNIACNSLINVTLEANCYKLITPDMVTEGNFGTCAPYREEDFTVIVYDGTPGNTVNRAGVYNYVVMWGPNSDEYCWGKINVEDKTPPTVTCPADVIGLVKSPGSELTVDGVGYQFRPGTAADVSCGEGRNVCDASCDQNPNFNYLVCTDVDRVLNVTRSYTDDKYPYFTGRATVTDCSATELVSVKDVLTEYDCSTTEVIKWGRQVTAVINRTFTYKDQFNNIASCTQKIYFFRPQIDLPVCKIELDQCVYPDVTQANSKTKIDPLALKIAPSYVNGVCQRIYFADHTCNLTLTFEDQVLPGPDHCGVKIIRTWTILDWCWKPGACDLFTTPSGCGSYLSGWSNKKATYEQHIIIGDKKAPELECPTVKVGNQFTTTQTFSTGPFNCTAVVNPLPPVVKNNECKGWTWEFELYGSVYDAKRDQWLHNQLIAMSSGQVVYGIAPGNYTIRYIVKDKCGNTSTIDCPAVVADRIAPVAICDDKLNVSIGGAGTTAEGLARVTAADVDEGSWDNCELVKLEVSREIEAACLVDSYDGLVNGLSWPADYDKKAAPAGSGYSFVYLARKDAPAKGVVKGDTLIAEKAGGKFFSWWAPAVFFTCCDISTDGQDRLTVELRATDKAGNTNICWQNILIEDKLPPVCEVHNKEILCTEVDFDVTTVEANPEMLHQRFGKPEDVVKRLDNCQADVEEAVTYRAGNCGTGVITRTFTVTDGSGRSVVCKQTITILEVNDYNIKFPGDVASAECGAQLKDDIKVSTDACDILAVNRDTARFEAEGQSDVCFKLLITYRVINWCEYDGRTLQPTVIPRDVDEDNDLDECTYLEAQYETGKFLNDNYKLCSGSWPSGGAFVVKVFAETKNSAGAYVRNALPTKILVRGTCSDNNTHVGYLVYRYNAASRCYEVYCGPQSVPSLCANLTYANQCWTPGFYEYTQIVKVYDNTPPTAVIENESLDFCAYGTPPNDCGGQVDITFTLDDECTPDLTRVRNVRLIVNNTGAPQDLTNQLYKVTRVAGTNSYTISGKLPVGSHTFVVSYIDGCGNTNALQIPFKVSDCKSPAPICIQTLSVDLMPVDTDNNGSVDDGMNTVWAKDYLASPIDDCSPFDTPDRVKYFVFKDSELPDGPEGVKLSDLTEARTSVVFTCEEVDQSVLTYVFALDKAGNFDYCLVMTLVRKGNSPIPCTGGGGNAQGQIAGLITTEEVDAVSGVRVQLSGQASMSYTTNDNGNYTFQNLIEGYDYSVTPSLDAAYLNGVSTFDLVLISKHILGVKPLGSPYKMIAADVNNSKSITTLDLIALRKLILSVDTKFSNNTSWRFVRKGYTFPNPANPWAEVFPEVLNVNDLVGSQLQHDFVAIKVGDVNSNARANGLMGTEVRGAAGTFELQAKDEDMKVGNEYRVAITSAQLAAIQGYQGTLTIDRSAAELVDIEYGLATEDNFGVFADQGLVTMSWNGQPSTANGQLFTLVLRARADAQLSQVLGISSRLTRAEAYTTTDEVLDVALNFGQGTMAHAGFELYQNMPNPFKGQTVIGFSLPQATTATVKVNDVNGRVLRVINGQFNAGYNEIRLNSSELGAAGVLYYTVETAEHTATRKMIVIE